MVGWWDKPSGHLCCLEVTDVTVTALVGCVTDITELNVGGANFWSISFLCEWERVSRGIKGHMPSRLATLQLEIKIAQVRKSEFLRRWLQMVKGLIMIP